jgi:hypothetical protein
MRERVGETVQPIGQQGSLRFSLPSALGVNPVSLAETPSMS